jgi:hypothetical protein
MTLIGPPWALSQITEKIRAKRDRRRARRLLTHGQLTEYLDTPCPHCGVLMTDWNGREDGSVKSIVEASVTAGPPMRRGRGRAK